MRFLHLTLLLALGAHVGCDRPGAGPTGPESAARLGLPAGEGLRLVVAHPPEAGAPPLGASLHAGLQRHRLGPRNDWTAALDGSLQPPFLLEIEPFGQTRPYHTLRRAVAGAPVWPLEMPLVPRVSLNGSLYLELLDLLQEFLAPWSGSRVSRWKELPQGVRLPELPEEDPYRTTCVEAIEVWNEAAGRTVLRAVAAPESATIRCTVFEESRAAFTRSEARDEAGHPLRLRVHLSRRWIEDFPRYIRRIWVHELGHALGLWGHSRDLEHVVNGRAVITDGPHPHELAALELLFRLPRGFDLSWIQRRWPPPGDPGPCPIQLPDVQGPGQQILHRPVPGREPAAEVADRTQ